ncbi:MAG: winged helix-turn-helix domain-containing protein [Nitrososphaerales archaeon]
MDSLKEDDSAVSPDNAVILEESIEILSTDDQRLKIIGEELSNDIGRAVLTKLFERVTSISEIARSLNVSVPLVSWHIQRLSKAGLIDIQHIKLSSKNKEVRHYMPVKFALIIIPFTVTRATYYSNILKSAIMKIYRNLPVVATFIGSAIGIYMIQRTITTDRPVFTIENPDRTPAIFISSDLVISLAIGASISTGIWWLIKFLRKRAKARIF